MLSIEKIKAWLSAPWQAKNVDRVFIQIGHIVGGYAIFLTALHHGYPAWLSAALVEVWSVPKEFWFDVKYESASVRGSGLLDFSMYQVGLLLSILFNVKV